MSESRDADIVIVGAGIIGLLTAWELSKAGHGSILVLDKGEPGREASWAAAGILSPLGPWRYPDSVQALAKESQTMFPALCNELQSASGIDPEYRQSGLLVLLDDGEHDQAQAWLGRNHVAHEFLSTADTQTRYTGLATDCRSLLMPEVAQVRTPRLLRALIRGLEKRGVQVRPHTAVRKLALGEAAINGVETAAGIIASETVILAAGAWTPELLPRGTWRPDIRPIKGQMLLYRPEDTALLQNMVLQGRRYLVSRSDGRILAGSTMEDDGFNKSPTLEVKQELRAFAEGLLPALAECELEAHWTGLRPGSPDGVPTVGAHPGIEGLWLNCGHYRNGIALAPATVGRLMTQLV